MLYFDDKSNSIEYDQSDGTRSKDYVKVAQMASLVGKPIFLKQIPIQNTKPKANPSIGGCRFMDLIPGSGKAVTIVSMATKALRN